MYTYHSTGLRAFFSAELALQGGWQIGQTGRPVLSGRKQLLNVDMHGFSRLAVNRQRRFHVAHPSQAARNLHHDFV
jgi:hypothetical protein